jgi:hypothetical protein
VNAAGITTVSIKADGRAAIERLAATLSARKGKRLTLNEAIIAADEYIRESLDNRSNDDYR